MQPFLGPDFLLDTETARRLFHEVAADLPIIDFHNHLPPGDIATDRGWETLGEAWLAQDHYKWRLMRWAGIEERLVTGPADWRARFEAFASILPRAYGNPVHHWAHLELWRYFALDGLVLSSASAARAWEAANACLARPEFHARGLLARMKVELVATTDDPADDLAHHRAFAAEGDATGLRMIPSFRPDRALALGDAGFPEWLERLAAAARCPPIRSFDDLLGALLARLDRFAALGARAADHGIDDLLDGEERGAAALDGILARRLAGAIPDDGETADWQTSLLAALGRAYAGRDMVMQLHIGVLRNTRRRLFDRAGRDAGADSIRDGALARPLNRLLDRLDRSDGLPRTILYALDPARLAVVSATAGNFQDGSRAGKVQAGPAWWFNDQLDGMEAQMRMFANTGLFGTFLGMLTDSRSFLSFPRHEYFRRLLCRLIGRWAEEGHIPPDPEPMAALVRAVCYDNARDWFAA